MELNYFKGKLFDLLNESNELGIADLNSEDRKNLLTETRKPQRRRTDERTQSDGL